MERLKKILHGRVSHKLIILLLFLASLYSWHLYSQTLGVLVHQRKALERLPTTDLSHMEINGYQLGQPFSGESAASDGICLDAEGDITELTYYLEPLRSRRGSDDIVPANTITDHGEDIGPTLETVRLGLSGLTDPQTGALNTMANEPDDNLYLSEARQETFIALNEESVEVAATTAAEAMAGSASEMTIILNGPFLYGVFADDDTLLFLGVVRNPNGG